MLVPVFPRLLRRVQVPQRAVPTARTQPLLPTLRLACTESLLFPPAGSFWVMVIGPFIGAIFAGTSGAACAFASATVEASGSGRATRR